MLENYRFALEAWREDEISPFISHHRERPRWLHVNVLELVKGFALHIPKVDLGKRVITAQSQVVSVPEGERLKDHGSSRRQSLDLSELLVGPFKDFGITNVAGHSQKQLTVHPERFHCHHVVYIWNFTMECEFLGVFVPQVDDRWLRPTG